MSERYPAVPYTLRPISMIDDPDASPLSDRVTAEFVSRFRERFWATFPNGATLSAEERVLVRELALSTLDEFLQDSEQGD